MRIVRGLVRGTARKARPLVWGSVGAGVAYLCDPDRGRSRRARLKDQAAAAVRRRSRDLGRKTRYLAGQARGAAATANPLSGVTQEALDDQLVVDKVRSEVLGSPEFRDLDVLVESAGGVVTLRGEVPDQSLIQRLESAVGAVTGVQRVANLLHPPDTPAPNKEAAREAS